MYSEFTYRNAALSPQKAARRDEPVGVWIDERPNLQVFPPILWQPQSSRKRTRKTRKLRRFYYSSIFKFQVDQVCGL